MRRAASLSVQRSLELNCVEAQGAQHCTLTHPLICDHLVQHCY